MTQFRINDLEKDNNNKSSFDQIREIFRKNKRIIYNETFPVIYPPNITNAYFSKLTIYVIRNYYKNYERFHCNYYILQMKLKSPLEYLFIVQVV